jgi:hypothetical protein
MCACDTFKGQSALSPLFDPEKSLGHLLPGREVVSQNGLKRPEVESASLAKDCSASFPLWTALSFLAGTSRAGTAVTVTQRGHWLN